MNSYISMDKNELMLKKRALQSEYDAIKRKGLKLDMSRGKPSLEQTELSMGMLEMTPTLKEEKFCVDGVDCRNYGGFDGLPSMKKLFSPLLGVETENIFVGGNSSLNLMFDVVSCFYTHGVGKGLPPWGKQGKIKFLCPTPGYDRHFSITEYFGFEMIPIEMSDHGPDMDAIEKLVSEDGAVKGIWCVPKYSNPTGITYSDETVRRFANLRPKAQDFRIIWDNAYCVHHLTDKPDELLNIMQECKKSGTEDLPITFTSTSKITFPGAGVAAIGASPNNMDTIRQRYRYATIGYNKLNQFCHVMFLKDYDNLLNHMKKHREIIKPKFDLIDGILNEELKPLGIAKWNRPKGGYFLSVDLFKGTATRVVELCRLGGVILTGAGAAFPKRQDPNDENIRIAPTFPPLEELKRAMELFCVCAKLAAAEKILYG